MRSRDDSGDVEKTSNTSEGRDRSELWDRDKEWRLVCEEKEEGEREERRSCERERWRRAVREDKESEEREERLEAVRGVRW